VGVLSCPREVLDRERHRGSERRRGRQQHERGEKRRADRLQNAGEAEARHDEAVEPRQRAQQRQRQEREEAGEELEPRIGAERVLCGSPRGERASRRESGHVHGEHERHGARGAAEDQAEGAHPERLVDQRRRAGRRHEPGQTARRSGGGHGCRGHASANLAEGRPP